MTSKLRSLIEKFRGNYYFHGEEIDVDKAKEILRVARDRISDSLKERELLEVMAHTISGCVWIKAYDYISESHTYEFANLTLCKSFFCFADSCLLNCTEHVKGKSDIELINEFMERFQKSHTFSDVCEITDEHTVEQAIRYHHTNGKSGAKNCRYLESGFIGDKAVLFDVTKTPLFEKGQKPCWNTHTYLVGTAIEPTICCDSVYQMGKTLLDSGLAETLCPGAIWIHPDDSASCKLLEKDLLGG